MTTLGPPGPAEPPGMRGRRLVARRLRRRGRPSKLSDRQWAAVLRRLMDWEPTSSVARKYGLAKSTISARFSNEVKIMKVLALNIVRSEFFEQIRSESDQDQHQLLNMHEHLLAVCLVLLRQKHGRHQGRHSEP